MNARLVLHECRRRGLEIRVEGGRLRLRGPERNLTPGLLASVRQHRDSLTMLVGTDSAEVVHAGPEVVHTNPGLVHKSGPHPGACGPSPWTTETDCKPHNSPKAREQNHLLSEIGPHGPHEFPEHSPARLGINFRPSEDKNRGDVEGYSFLSAASSVYAGNVDHVDHVDQSLKTAPFLDPSARWTGTTDPDFEPDPGLVISRDWRTTVARWPMPKWLAWRRRSTEIQSALAQPVSAKDIHRADHAAFLELVNQPYPGGPAHP